MNFLIHDCIFSNADRTPAADAVFVKQDKLSYGELARAIEEFANGLSSLGVRAGERIAIYLPKQFETVIAIFAASRIGAVFVPVNTVLKARQVQHILQDSGASVLITSLERQKNLADELGQCDALRHILLTNATEEATATDEKLKSWQEIISARNSLPSCPAIDTDTAAILYTSGSTGKPKGVVLSHKNMVTGAHSVATYLANSREDKLLAVLPFSFDYGLSQLTTAFSVGASVVLMDYLLPRDVIRAVAKHSITGLAAVPPLWKQLALLEWPVEAVQSLRYLTNSGGAMPAPVTAKLRMALPNTQVFLMYGLTEAFRSTYLPPDELDRRPTSIGKAIPNARVMVVRPDGTECGPDEAGELVHMGSLVAKGYWRDPQKTSVRFKPAPGQPCDLPLTEIAVWSGDQVTKDADGYLYFITRQDEMIKTSGYRVSPTEVEDEVYASGLVAEAIAFGIADETLGQAIVVVAEAMHEPDSAALTKHCQQSLPNFMVPAKIVWYEKLPRNPNGKIDRNQVKAEVSANLSSD